jgi:FkbM family methyltransferase
MVSLKKTINYIRDNNIYIGNVFDIGSRDANDAIYLRDSFKLSDTNIYTFECNKNNYNKIINKYPNINTYNFGIYNYDGKKQFNAITSSKTNNTGVSSFRRENSLTTSDTRVYKQYIVDVKRMDTFIDENNIKSLDYVKIDVEGCSYECLEGFGDKLNIVKSLHIENEHIECWYNQTLYPDIKLFL